MNIIHFDIIDSTNTYLKNNYNSLDDYTFVSASLQTHGRGRNNRIWNSNQNENLLFSLLLKNKECIDMYKSISIITAYSIIEVLKDYQINNLYLKWPNDVYVGDKKICGILLESVSKNDIECLIVGVGLNVNQSNFEGEYIIDPTSMKKIINIDIDIDLLKKRIYERILFNIDKILKGHDFYKDFIKYDYLKDREVYMELNNQKKKVKVIGINPNYSLRILIDEEYTDVEAGEVSFHV